MFSTFGEVKSVRIPKKFGGGHRGFAFVEFVTETESKKAFDSLQSTHFYGRHLVLEWSKDSKTTGLDNVVAKKRVRPSEN